MNILVISKVDGRPWIGPTYSIPKQVSALSKLDNVLWYNLVSEGKPEGKTNLQKWRKLDFYTDLNRFPSAAIKSLPKPFNNPDLIIIQQNYPFAKDKIRFEIMRSRIPYIIIPRGEFTATAQKKKRLKKILGNTLLGYYPYVKKALAIQCLTEEEKNETDISWNNCKIVLPNGTDIPDYKKTSFTDVGINCVFIGRIEPYQKGLDLLVTACSKIKNELRNANCKISIYGSDQENKASLVRKQVIDNELNDIISFNAPIFGEEKKDVLKSSDIFILTSRFEGHPTGLLEALAFGLPSLITTGANMRKEVDEYDCGWTAETTTESIKIALLQMINDKANYQKKSNNARILAQKFAWDAIAQQSHSVYETLLLNNRGI